MWGNNPDYFDGCGKIHPKYGWRFLTEAKIKDVEGKTSLC